LGHFKQYAVKGCRHCKHPQTNPHGNCNYSEAKVYISKDGKRKMVKGKCKTGHRSTTFMAHDVQFLAKH
jgi:hypothetical protein